jgi:Na+/H+ antiporter NhaD/arsenite permease-like protein
MLLTLTVFLLAVFFIIWRPRGINEAIPTTAAAVCILMIGIVPLVDVYNIFGVVSGASFTILSTIVMSIVLESIGFFMRSVKLKPHQQIPYLLSGAMVATGASAPIGVSNLANLIALKIVNMDLNTYAAMMFVPSMIGMAAMDMYVVVYGLRNSGLTGLLVSLIDESVAASRFHAIFIMGMLLTLLSNLCNNLPAVMIGTLSLTTMGLDQRTIGSVFGQHHWK